VTNEQLIPTHTDIFEDIYERSGGTTTLISTGSHAFNSFFEDASANGSRVVFSTLERLSPNDTDSAFDLYERSGGTTTLVTEGEINGNGDFPAPFFGASADGNGTIVTIDAFSRHRATDCHAQAQAVLTVP
jgi:hypothetical protein